MTSESARIDVPAPPAESATSVDLGEWGLITASFLERSTPVLVGEITEIIREFHDMSPDTGVPAEIPLYLEKAVALIDGVDLERINTWTERTELAYATTLVDTIADLGLKLKTNVDLNSTWYYLVFEAGAITQACLPPQLRPLTLSKFQPPLCPMEPYRPVR